jgi:hypothetical protein
MITVDELIRQPEVLKEGGILGETPVVIDCGQHLAEVVEVDLGASDEGVVIWCGDVVE